MSITPAEEAGVVVPRVPQVPRVWAVAVTGASVQGLPERMAFPPLAAVVAVVAARHRVMAAKEGAAL